LRPPHSGEDFAACLERAAEDSISYVRVPDDPSRGRPRSSNLTLALAAAFALSVA